MTTQSEGLNDFHKTWRLESDTIYCKGCKRGLHVSRDGELLNHRSGCRHGDEHHPWARLRALIAAPLPKPVPGRIYLAGPMTGYPELNFPAFHAEAARLRSLGYDVVNPAEINPDPAADWIDCMRADIRELVTCGTIATLPGWEQSKGATFEASIADRLAMNRVMARDIKRPPFSSLDMAGITQTAVGAA